MGSGSPPASKPSAIPSHMLNGSSPLQRSSTGNRDERERESLNSSIRSSFEPRVPLQFAPETVAAVPTESTSAASVPIRNVVPVRYVSDDIYAIRGLSFISC
jgi:GTP cyclohydrolase I